MPLARDPGPRNDALVGHGDGRRGRLCLLVTFVLGILVAPLAAAAQPAKVARIGYLSAAGQLRSASPYKAFVPRLHELGYVEGENLTVEFRTAEGQAARMPALAAELARLKVDAIIASGPEATLRAARDATSTIPIVMVAIDYDPIARQYVAALPRPGGNITGLFFQQIELTAKRLEILRETLGKVARVMLPWDPFSADQLKAAEAAAPSLGLQIQAVEMKGLPYDYEAAFRAARGRVRAAFVPMSPVFFRERSRLAEAASKARLSAIFGTREFVESGGLASYGPNMNSMFRRVAEYVDKILKGAKPADLPVEQPTRFGFVINMKTAKALGITFPQSILIRADHVIQ